LNAPPADRYDVAIVGGGMVGASLGLALNATRLRVLLIEAVPADAVAQPSFDDRTTSLGNGACRILSTLGVWDAISTAAAPIREIHVSDAGHFGCARLRAGEHRLPAFGYTVSNRHIGASLWSALKTQPIELCCPARVLAVTLAPDAAQLRIQDQNQNELLITARLVVAADGANSVVKQAAGIASKSESYESVAVVCNVKTDRAAHGVAYERFSRSGPLAMLPLHDGAYAVVWALPPDVAKLMTQCDEAQFRGELQQQFGWRAGQFTQISSRGSYPLALVHAQLTTATRVALIGNAAQALHPIAAQGFNLGLRDAAVLAELIACAPDPGAPEVLQAFAARRSFDREGMIAFTDRLVKAFRTTSTPAVVARNLALLLFDITPPAKAALSSISWGFGGSLPRLSRGLPLL
jgi:2-octaprenyl-6-methoxyphenol hydroxylase